LRISDILEALYAHLESGYDVPWVPTRRSLIPHILRLARIRKGTVFYDLGCGDGRVAIEAARLGAHAVCVEIRSDLIKLAQRHAENKGVQGRIKFVNADFRDVDLSDADVVYMYLLTRVNEILRPKLEKELRIGARIITLDFTIPLWRPVHMERYYTSNIPRVLYLYIRGVSDIYWHL
jgi:ubiquinone/menaquinone biosynthesis C-methylase UbiE